MKQSLPAFALTFVKGLRTLLFHPMLYIAILLHWGLFNLPSPIEQSEQNEEELLDESIPIASSASLGVKSENKPKSNDKAKEKKKEKPKPLAEALVKSDPELAKLAEEKKREEEEARKKAEELKKAEEAKKKAEAEKKHVESDKKAETEASKTEKDKDSEIPRETKTDDSDSQDTEDNTTDGDITDSEGDSSDGQNTTAQQFNLELLPNPELVFTPNSLAAYNPGFNALEFQSSVEDARTLETTTSIEKAIQAITALPEFQDFSFSEPIFDDRKDPQESGLGVVYAIQLADKTKYVSFIRRSSRWARKNRKNTLRSTTVFVLWSENPLS